MHSMVTSSSIWFKEACLWRHVDSPLFQFPSLDQHGKEGSQEGSSRGPKGDESDEGQEGIKVSSMKSCVMLPAGWHRSFQILATCIWARTWDVRSYTWVWSVAMAGVENWQHGMLHRALNKLYSCSFWQGSKLFGKILNLLLGYTGMGLVDFKGGFKFASEVTHVPVYFFGTGRNNW